MKKFYLLFFAACSSLCSGATIDEAGHINKIRAVSSSHSSVDQYVSVFTLTPIQSTCTWIKLAPDSDTYMSTLLFAKAQDIEVKVWYDDASCETVTIEIK